MRPYWLGSPNFLHFCGWAGKSLVVGGWKIPPSRATSVDRTSNEQRPAAQQTSLYITLASLVCLVLKSMAHLWRICGFPMIPRGEASEALQHFQAIWSFDEFWIVGRFHPLVLSQSVYGWKVKTQLPPFPSISQPYRYAAAPFCPPQDLFEGVLEERRLCRSCGLVRVPWRQHFSEKVQWWLNQQRWSIMGISWE